MPANRLWLWLAGGAAVLYVLTRPRATAGAIEPPATPGSPGESVEPTVPGVPGVPPAVIPEYVPPGETMTGTAFAASVARLTGSARDAAALEAAARGSVPSLLHTWKPVPVASGALRGTVYVTPDFFGVGTDADWVRWPLLPGAAQRLADAWGAVLPTKKIADAIHAAADVNVRMPTSSTARDAVATIVATSRRADERIAERVGIADGHRKNILAADARDPRKVVIYGALHPDTGAWPLQPYSTVHSDGYVDYSHGVRLVRRAMDVAGRGAMDILDVMRDPALAPLVSDRAGDRGTRYT